MSMLFVNLRDVRLTNNVAKNLAVISNCGK